MRVAGALGVAGAIVSIVSGIANQRAPRASVHFATPAFYAVCAFLLLAAAGTIALRKIAAVAFTAPLAAVGLWCVGAVILEGPAAAIALNLLLTLPMLTAPAFVVYWNWRCLR